MRIAIPIHSFEPGGVERVALRLAGAWQEAGDQVEIILGRDEGPCRPSDKELTYSRLTEPVPTARWETLWMIWSLWRFLSRHQVDVIFCPGNTYTVVCVAMRLLLGRRCPPCLVKISNDLDRPDFPRPVRVLYGCWLRLQGAVLDQFVAIGAPMRSQLEGRLGIPENRTSVIPDPALDEVPAIIPARLRRRPNPTACRFIAVGRLVPQKNLRLALEAFAIHGWPDDTLTIAGDGPERRSLEMLAAKLHLGERARFIGHSGAVDDLLREADVFVLSSDYEGVPAVILEALVAGLPIAATDCCASMRWLLQDEAFGPGSAIEESFDHRTRQKRMVRGCHQYWPWGKRSASNVPDAGRDPVPTRVKLKPWVGSVLGKVSLQQSLGILRHDHHPCHRWDRKKGFGDPANHRLPRNLDEGLQLLAVCCRERVRPGTSSRQEYCRPSAANIVGRRWNAPIAGPAGVF